MGVQKFMSLMELSYMEVKIVVVEFMWCLLFVGLFVVVRVDGEIIQGEVEVFEKFLGKGVFKDIVDVGVLEKDFDNWIEWVREEVGVIQVMQVF